MKATRRRRASALFTARDKCTEICPLQLQHGDTLLLLSADQTLRSYGVRLADVSEDGFESCSAEGGPPPPGGGAEGGSLLGRGTIGSAPAYAVGRLVPGLHYFVAATHEGGDGRQLCQLGLRLNVSVRRQLCQSSPLVRLCSGNGVCQAGPGDEAYRCRCHEHYTGKLCQKFDACLNNPCGNKGVCLSDGSGDADHRTYKCLCPPHFTGVNCSEVIGRENCERVCPKASCVQVSPASFKCICETGFSGPACERRNLACGSDPCANGGTCELDGDSFSCRCPGGFSGPTCAVNCLTFGCRKPDVCANASECACAEGAPDPVCGGRAGPCLPSPCLNNGSCVSRGDDYACRCLEGFAGKNCEEELIDYCGQLNINCPNEGLCLSIIGGYKCVCAPGWTGEFCQQHVGGDACTAHPQRCVNGATCVTTSGPLTSPPQLISCICPRGFTGGFSGLVFTSRVGTRIRLEKPPVPHDNIHNADSWKDAGITPSKKTKHHHRPRTPPAPGDDDDDDDSGGGGPNRRVAVVFALAPPATSMPLPTFPC
ncbi:unnamed protein product [Boreogadus saida]